MQGNQREGDYTEMGNNRYGGYAQGNSGSGNYRGGKRSNAGRNSKSSGKSSFASPEMQKAVWMIAAIPVTFVLLVVGYFVTAACGGLS